MQLMKKITVMVLALLLGTSGLVAQVQAAMIGAPDVLRTEQRLQVRDRMAQLLTQESVQRSLQALGVAPEQARARVQSLTDEDLDQLATRLDELPAGSGALEVIGIVFLVLLVLELVGVTNIFNRI